MKPIIFGESVRGASHKRVDKECQDSYKKLTFKNANFIAVADGHGSEACPYSKTGSLTAVNVFCHIMMQYYLKYEDNIEMLLTYFNREGETKVAQSIAEEWKRRILKTHTDNKRNQLLNQDGKKDEWAICKQYGTTLLGMLITYNFIFAFQLGDGDIVYVDEDNTEPVIMVEKILGVETHSLSKPDNWKKAISVTKRIDLEKDRPYAFLLTTDGFANSFASNEEYNKTCKEYFSMIKEHGASIVADNLKKWLSETSEMGCGDDITMICAYFPSQPEVPSNE